MLIKQTLLSLIHNSTWKLTDHIVLKIGNGNIKQKSYVKFLRELLDSNLNWNIHLAELFRRLARTAGLFYKIRHEAPTKTLILLCDLIFAPFLSYGLPVCCSTYPSLLDFIHKLVDKLSNKMVNIQP